MATTVTMHRVIREVADDCIAHNVKFREFYDASRNLIDLDFMDLEAKPHCQCKWEPLPSDHVKRIEPKGKKKVCPTCRIQRASNGANMCWCD